MIDVDNSEARYSDIPVIDEVVIDEVGEFSGDAVALNSMFQSPHPNTDQERLVDSDN